MISPPEIRFVEMPTPIRERYQYYTRAETSKIISAGFVRPFTSLEHGISDYVNRFWRIRSPISVEG